MESKTMEVDGIRMRGGRLVVPENHPEEVAQAVENFIVELEK